VRRSRVRAFDYTLLARLVSPCDRPFTGSRTIRGRVRKRRWRRAPCGDRATLLPLNKTVTREPFQGVGVLQMNA
jgi:hypothetical protein